MSSLFFMYMNIAKTVFGKFIFKRMHGLFPTYKPNGMVFRSEKRFNKSKFFPNKIRTVYTQKNKHLKVNTQVFPRKGIKEKSEI